MLVLQACVAEVHTTSLRNPRVVVMGKGLGMTATSSDLQGLFKPSYSSSLGDSFVHDTSQNTPRRAAHTARKMTFDSDLSDRMADGNVLSHACAMVQVESKTSVMQSTASNARTGTRACPRVRVKVQEALGRWSRARVCRCMMKVW